MLTPEEFEKLKTHLSTGSPAATSGSKTVVADRPGYFSRLGKRYTDAAVDIVAEGQKSYEAEGFGNQVRTGLRTGLRTAGEVADVAFAPITEAVAPILEPVVKKIASIPGVEKQIKRVSEWAKRNPDAAKDLEAVLNIVSLPAGAKATTAGTKTAAKTTAKTAEKTGTALKATGERAYRVAAPMEQATARSVQAFEAQRPTLWQRIFGKNPNKIEAPIRESETAARHGIAGTEWQMGVKAKRVANEIWEGKISPALTNFKEKVDMREVFKDIRARIIAENKDLSRRNTLLEALESMNEDFRNVSKVSLKKLQAYKEGWAKFVPEKTYKGKPIAGALNEVRNMAAQEARARIYKLLGNDIKRDYLDYGNLQSLVESGIKSVDALRSKGITKQVWEFVIDKTVTPIASYGGLVLYRTGEGLEFIGKEGAKKVGDILKQAK